MPTTWVISDQVTMEGIPLVITGDVVVADGGELRLLGVDAQVVSLANRPITVTVEGGGRLEMANGTDGLGSTKTTHVASTQAPWNLVLDPGASFVSVAATLEDARVRSSAAAVQFQATDLRLNAGPLVVAAGTTLISGGVLRDSPSILLHAQGGSLHVDGSALHGAEDAGVVVDASAELTLEDVELGQVGAYALDVREGHARVHRSVFEGAAGYAVRAEGGTLLLEDNTFDGHCGAFVLAGTNTVVQRNTFEVSGHGLTLEEAGSAYVVGNTFDRVATGVNMVAGASRVEANIFLSAAQGIRVENATAEILGNRFQGTDVGVDVLGTQVDLILRGNSFAPGGDAGVRNTGQASIDARWNWWGSSTGPAPPGSGAAIQGAVVVDPWLSQPP